MRYVMFIAGFAALLCVVGRDSNASDWDKMPRPWYETLRPGVTRSEISKLAGNPVRSEGSVDTYDVGGGRIEFAFEKDVLRTAVGYNLPGDGVSWTLYKTRGASNNSDLKQRRAYLKAGNFSVMPDFPGRSVYTLKYPAINERNDSGACYEVDGGFIVAEPIICLLGGVGFFADKTARVLWVGPDGTEKVLYRAADHWEALRPPGLSEIDVKNRKMKLKTAGDHLLQMKVADVLGQCDSYMGSGINYQLYYFEDGLGIANASYPNGTLASMRIVKPGLTNLTLMEWLNDAKPNTSTNSLPPAR